jgi:hypothetical protein
MTGRLPLRSTLAVAALVALVIDADAARVNRARLAWSAFECSLLAELAEEKKEQERLFSVGLTYGATFISDVIAKKAHKSEVEDMPVGFSWVLGGPNADFILGRVYESAIGDAYDSIVKHDANGIPINDPAKWNMDEELKASLAQTEFLKSNCVLIR